MEPEGEGRIYFVRHGESEANVRHVIANRGRSYGLTAVGRAQARALAARLPMGRVQVVYHSPLARAAETGRHPGRRPCALPTRRGPGRV